MIKWIEDEVKQAWSREQSRQEEVEMESDMRWEGRIWGGKVIKWRCVLGRNFVIEVSL